MTDDRLADRIAIRDVVESWVIARDSADWERFRAQWHGARGAATSPASGASTMPGRRGPEVEALYARGAAWLAGLRVAP
jgi:hypothetical protein